MSTSEHHRIEQAPAGVIVEAARLMRAAEGERLNELVGPYVNPSPLHAAIFVCCVGDLVVRMADYSGHSVAVGYVRAGTTDLVAPDVAPLGLRVAVTMINHMASSEPQEALAAFMAAVVADDGGDRDWPSQTIAFALSTLADELWGTPESSGTLGVVRLR